MAAGEEQEEQRKRDQLKEMAKTVVDVPLPVKTSDLPKRAASAVVMLVIAGTAFWIGGLVLDLFIALVAAATAGEFARLVWKATDHPARRALSLVFGLAYISVAAVTLIAAWSAELVMLIGTVICVDTFAYFSGRTFGGPKIAPRISPSKTWAGLAGGGLGAGLFLILISDGPRMLCELNRPATESPAQFGFDGGCSLFLVPDALDYAGMLLVGLGFAIVAQSGDFLESWLKRKAGMKDSSNLIPGHGGVFDRTDGLIAVAFVYGVVGYFLL